jgi:hypothetical protein
VLTIATTATFTASVDFTSQTAPFISISSTSTADITTYSASLSGTLDNYPLAGTITATFAVIVSQCNVISMVAATSLLAT